MSYAIKNWLDVYSRWRESYLTAHPEKRLFPWLFGSQPLEDSEAPIERERRPFISFTPEFGQRIEGAKWAVALLAIFLFLRNE